jgi:hypothetical protein
VGRVELWSVYEQPVDHPDSCAVRKILVEDDGLSPGEWELFRSLQEARSVLARRGLIRVPRGPQDDPALVEFWL